MKPKPPPVGGAFSEPHLHLRMMSSPTFLSGVREMVGSVCKRLGFTDMQCSQIALAIDEALCNVMRHGYRRASDKPIWVSLWSLDSAGMAVSPGAPAVPAASGTVSELNAGSTEPDAVRIVIEDLAEQVDPACIKSRDLDDIRPGGLGVHIIKEVMDEAVYERREGGVGMRLTMVKKRSSNKPTPPTTPNSTNSCGTPKP